MATVRLRDEITQLASVEGAERWKAVEYSYILPRWHDGLQAEIETHFSDILAKVKETAAAEAAAEARRVRDKLLADSDQRVAIDRLGLSVPSGSTFTAWISFFRQLGDALSGRWAAYRQQLRDLPASSGWPYNIQWPQRPDGE